MGGGGPKYEEAERALLNSSAANPLSPSAVEGPRTPPAPDDLLLDVRKERIEDVLAHRTRTLTVRVGKSQVRQPRRVEIKAT